MDDQLKKIQKQYNDIPIPSTLENMIEKNLHHPKKRKKSSIFLTSLAAALALFIIGLNTNPALAKSLADIPVIGPVVQILTFTKYEVIDNEYIADIEVPQLSGSSNEITALNEQYATEGKALYEQFQKEIQEMEAGNMLLNSGYIVETDNEDILSFGRYIEVTVVSSSAVMTYTTIDKKEETVIPLPSLFKDERYLEIISDYLVNEMQTRMKETEGSEIYFVAGTEYFDITFGGVFEKITPEQNFFITDNGKLVIAFDTYEVGPGFMGLVNFEIPTEIIQELLVSNKYIK